MFDDCENSIQCGEQMSKMGLELVEDKLKYIPKDIVDFSYSISSGAYTIYFYSDKDCACIENISELDMLIIADSLEKLREDG